MKNVFVVISDYHPHNDDYNSDCDIFASLEKAKEYLKNEVEDYVRWATTEDEDGYQYCEDMEYVNWNEDMTSCTLCTSKEDYLTWFIEEKIINL